jgi:hypothetical protein
MRARKLPLLPSGAAGRSDGATPAGLSARHRGAQLTGSGEKAATSRARR